MKAAAFLALSLIALPSGATSGPDLTGMFRAGQATHQRVTAGADEKRFWFTTQELYTVTLYVDEAEARRVLEPFRGRQLPDLQKDARVYEAIAASPMAKVLVLEALHDLAAADVVADFNEQLGKKVRVSSKELTTFVRCFRSDWPQGDRAVLRIADGTTVSASRGEEACPDIENQKFARALLEVWFGAEKLTGLLAEAGPLIGLPAVPPPARPAAGPSLPGAPARAAETLTAAQQAARSHNSRGLELIQNGRPDAAEREFAKAVELDPEFAPAHANLGAALGAQEKWDEAMLEFQEAIGLDPEDAQTYYNLGTALLEDARAEEAIPELQEAARLDPLDSKIHNNLGVSFMILDRHDEAQAEFEQVVRLRPDDATGHLNLARIRHMKGDLDTAISEYRSALKLDPREARAHYYLGRALEAKGLTREAKKEIGEAIRLDPKFASKTD